MAVPTVNLFSEFIAYTLKKRPYDLFCQQENLQAFHDLPTMLLSQFRGRISKDCAKCIEQNIFVPEPLKKYLLGIYVRASRLFVVLRFTIGRCVRRRRQVQTEQDLSLSPFAHPSTYFDLFDRGKRYRFKFSDMLNHIHSSLTHSIEYITDPVHIKNPYTGLVFSEENLYAIYLHLKESRYTIPPLFLHFMETDFNLEKFSVKYECLLRDIIIRASIENMSTKKRRLEIRNMLGAIRVYHPLHNRCEKIFRNLDGISCSELDQFKDWLHLYFLHLCSLNTYYAHVSLETLMKEMLEFTRTHPKFGAKSRVI